MATGNESGVARPRTRTAGAQGMAIWNGAFGEARLTADAAALLAVDVASQLAEKLEELRTTRAPDELLVRTIDAVDAVVHHASIFAYWLRDARQQTKWTDVAGKPSDRASSKTSEESPRDPNGREEDARVGPRKIERVSDLPVVNVTRATKGDA